jgi:hypothetical protein
MNRPDPFRGRWLQFLLSYHEWYMYVFDGMPMAVAIAIWNLVPQQLSCRVHVVSEGQLDAATYRPKP